MNVMDVNSNVIFWCFEFSFAWCHGWIHEVEGVIQEGFGKFDKDH